MTPPSSAAPLAHVAPLASGLTKEYLLHHRLCPIALGAQGRLRVAVAPAALASGLEDLSFVYRAPIDECPVSTAELVSLIERAIRAGDKDVHVAQDAEPAGDDLSADVRNLANQPPVVRFVNLLIRDAFESGASDVHLEATRTGLTTRYRLDGVLTAANDPPPELQPAVVSRIKLLAELDIAERRRPQDGRIRVRLEDRELDLRVSTVPTTHGESVVLRLLERGGATVALDDLGVESDALAKLVQLVKQPHGLVLVTGPTGSGKTTTLYAALARRDATAEKIITVEDPVEYQLNGVTQMPIHRQAGVTFPSARCRRGGGGAWKSGALSPAENERPNSSGFGEGRTRTATGLPVPIRLARSLGSARTGCDEKDRLRAHSAPSHTHTRPLPTADTARSLDERAHGDLILPQR